MLRFKVALAVSLHLNFTLLLALLPYLVAPMLRSRIDQSRMMEVEVFSNMDDTNTQVR